MTSRRAVSFGFLAVALALVGVSGCQRDINVLEPAAYATDGDVFTDGFGAGVQFQAFGDAKLDALEIDASEKHSGTRSMKITVPNEGYAYSTYAYAGGVLVTSAGRNLTAYNALTFWARASVEASFGSIGYGNDNTGTSKYTVQQSNVPLHTIWTYYVIPIPASAKLVREKGQFFFAAANKNGFGYNIWIDDVKFEHLKTISNPRTSITSSTLNNAIEGDTLVINNSITVTVNINGTDQKVDASPSYLTYRSSAESVATVNTDGIVRVVGAGNAVITASLGSVAATGTVTLNNVKAAAGPAAAAPTPTVAAGKVISLFSDAYTNRPIDTWSADWPNTAKVADLMIGSDNVKRYSTLDFAGIVFAKNPIDASAMTHFHMDIWTQYPTASAAFRIKLVDFGANGVLGGGDDVQSEVIVTAGSTPAPLKTDAWVSLDLPLTDFAALTTMSRLGQLIISGDLKTVWVDNIYLYQGYGSPGQTVPSVVAPTPSIPNVNVISLFSDGYTSSPVNTWSASWDRADQTYRSVAGNDVFLYTNLEYAGIEFTGSNMLDVSSMDFFHMDIWTPNVTTTAGFTITLVDFGADGVYGGGNDTQFGLTFTASSSPTPLRTGSWVSFDIPMSSFTGLTSKAHLAQLILAASGALKTVWVDNVYFYRVSPASPAPTPPTRAAGDVISLFSDAYANRSVNGDVWAASWQYSTAVVTNKTIGSDNVKVYTNLNFAGIEFTGANMIDASGMAYFHMDIWTPNSVTAPSAFKILLVDFGANGSYGGGDDASHELTFTASSVPPLVSSGWVSFDIPLSNFAGLTNRAHLAQLVISSTGDVKTVWVDNVYFHK